MKLYPVDKVQVALVSGEKLTLKQIASRYKVVNPRDVIYKLKNRGVTISRKKSVDKRGNVTYKYAAK